jgi:hypothetical protein
MNQRFMLLALFTIRRAYLPHTLSHLALEPFATTLLVSLLDFASVKAGESFLNSTHMPALMLQAATAADATASTIVSTSSTETNFFIDISLPQRHIVIVGKPSRAVMRS